MQTNQKLLFTTINTDIYIDENTLIFLNGNLLTPDLDYTVNGTNIKLIDIDIWEGSDVLCIYNNGICKRIRF